MDELEKLEFIREKCAKMRALFHEEIIPEISEIEKLSEKDQNAILCRSTSVIPFIQSKYEEALKEFRLTSYGLKWSNETQKAKNIRVINREIYEVAHILNNVLIDDIALARKALDVELQESMEIGKGSTYRIDFIVGCAFCGCRDISKEYLNQVERYLRYKAEFIIDLSEAEIQAVMGFYKIEEAFWFSDVQYLHEQLVDTIRSIKKLSKRLFFSIKATNMRQMLFEYQKPCYIAMLEYMKSIILEKDAVAIRNKSIDQLYLTIEQTYFDSIVIMAKLYVLIADIIIDDRVDSEFVDAFPHVYEFLRKIAEGYR